ncbi:MAG: prepilin-type N-terminal cleavage/methylation domain-containing protein [Acidimicrobiales bacterium]|jgi:prepilin-type N-terminal cleavage/methylation domain-containing protein
MTGFSLIEFILVVALFGIVTVFAFPVSLSFYNAQVLSEIEGGVETSIRNAQMYAVTQKNDSSHGVKMLSGQYVLFQGDSYSTRDGAQDASFALPSTLQYSGVDEIVFAQHTGYPSATGTLTFTYAHATQTLLVYDSGFVK